jgi:AcrR family transcriptional regulator
MGGRPRSPALDDARKVALARRLYDDPANSIGDICRTLGVSRSTLYRHLDGAD